MSDELKACGNCGSSGKVRMWNPHLYHVCCSKCGATSAKYPDEEEAIAAWNRRVVTREQVEKMARELAGGRASAEDMCEARFMSAAMLRAAGFEVAE